MNYDNEQRLAMNQIREHDETDLELLEQIEKYIIEPRDVLYYLNAFGDLDLAVTIHPLPKDLPKAVLEQMGKYDVLNDWQGTVNEHECPVCHSTLYEFDWMYDYIVLNEYGENEGEEIWYLNDPAGFYWDTTGEHKLMCGGCANSRSAFSRDMDSHHGVKVYYGEEDEWFPFSLQGSVVRWDGEWYMDNQNVTDRNIPTADHEDYVGMSEVAEAFALGGDDSKRELMEKLGWTHMQPIDLDVEVSGIRRAKRYAKEVLEGWGSVTDATEKHPTHPDFDFTYIIEDGDRIYFPESEWNTVKHHWEDQVLFEANEVEALKEHRASVDA